MPNYLLFLSLSHTNTLLPEILENPAGPFAPPQFFPARLLVRTIARTNRFCTCNLYVQGCFSYVQFVRTSKCTGLGDARTRRGFGIQVRNSGADIGFKNVDN